MTSCSDVRRCMKIHMERQTCLARLLDHVKDRLTVYPRLESRNRPSMRRGAIGPNRPALRYLVLPPKDRAQRPGSAWIRPSPAGGRSWRSRTSLLGTFSNREGWTNTHGSFRTGGVATFGGGSVCATRTEETSGCVSKCVGEVFACVCLEQDIIIVISKASHAIDTRWPWFVFYSLANSSSRE